MLSGVKSASSPYAVCGSSYIFHSKQPDIKQPLAARQRRAPHRRCDQAWLLPVSGDGPAYNFSNIGAIMKKFLSILASATVLAFPLAMTSTPASAQAPATPPAAAPAAPMAAPAEKMAPAKPKAKAKKMRKAKVKSAKKAA
jgi:hypothetical protein